MMAAILPSSSMAKSLRWKPGSSLRMGMLSSLDGDAFFLEDVSEFPKLILVDHLANNHVEVHSFSFSEH